MIIPQKTWNGNTCALVHRITWWREAWTTSSKDLTPDIYRCWNRCLSVHFICPPLGLALWVEILTPDHYGASSQSQFSRCFHSQWEVEQDQCPTLRPTCCLHRYPCWLQVELDSQLRWQTLCLRASTKVGEIPPCAPSHTKIPITGTWALLGFRCFWGLHLAKGRTENEQQFACERFQAKQLWIKEFNSTIGKDNRFLCVQQT